MEDPTIHVPHPDILPEREPPRTGENSQSKQIADETGLTIYKYKSSGRNLVVCIDGTSNQSGQKNTNVIELYRNLVKDDTQVTFYNSGIGTYARPSWKSWSYLKQVVDNKIDLAVAWNFKKIVISAYRWLSENYRGGDRIFLFGFSRGAYQVRALSAMIAKVGLIHKGNEGQIPFAYELYANPRTSERKEQEAPTAETFKETFSHNVRVHFVGAWDTVSSVGIVRDKTLPNTAEGMRHVCFFRHALALDERRVKYLPEYTYGGRATKRESYSERFTSSVQHAEDSIPHTKEVWFAGTHSDIGGGNVKNSNLDRGKPALRWMSREAESFGLYLAPRVTRWDWEKLGAVNDSLTLAWRSIELLPIKRLSYKGKNSTTFWPHLGKGRQIDSGQRLHASVIFSSDKLYKPRAQLWPDGKGKELIIPLTDANSTVAAEDWSLVETDLLDIAQAIVRDFEGLNADPRPAARRLQRLTSSEKGIKIVHEIPRAIELLSLVWHILGFDDSDSSRDTILNVLKELGNIENDATMPRLHAPGVTSSSISPDGRFIVSASSKGSIQLWNANTREAVGVAFEAHNGVVASVQFSSDGRRIVSGSWDGFIRVSDTRTGRKISEWKTKPVTSVVFSPDGRCVVSGSWDTKLRFWETGTDEAIGKSTGRHADSITCATFSPDGKYLASGSLDRTLRVWDTRTWKAIGKPLQGHVGPVTCVAFSPDGNCIASGAGDENVRVWDKATGQSSKPFRGHTSTVTSIAFSPDGKYLASGSLDQTIRVWKVDSGQAIGNPFTGHTGSVTSVVFSMDGRHIISGSLDGSIKSWFAFPLQGHRKRVSSVGYSPDGKDVVSGSWDGTIRMWNTETGEDIKRPFRGHTDDVTSVAYSPDGKHVVSGSDDVTVRVWSTETGEAIGEPFRGRKRRVLSIAYSPDGKRVVSGLADGMVQAWNMETSEVVGRPFRVHKSSVFSVAYSPDGKHVVSGSWDYTIRVWNAETGTAIGEPLRGHTDNITSIAFSPDGKRIVSSSWDHTIRVWNAQNGEAIGKPLRGHTDTVRSVTYTPDGRHIISGSYDGTIRIWDTETGVTVGTPLQTHHGEIVSIAISRDGKHVVSGGGSWGTKAGYVNIWNLKNGNNHQSSSAVLQPHSFLPVWSINISKLY